MANIYLHNVWLEYILIALSIIFALCVTFAKNSLYAILSFSILALTIGSIAILLNNPAFGFIIISCYITSSVLFILLFYILK